MGLDMYAYSASKEGAQTEYYDSGEYNKETGTFVSTAPAPKELAYWRKHPNLHGWMEELWHDKGYPGAAPSDVFNPDQVMFNGVELELTWDDLELLEEHVTQGKLPPTSGFFFGDGADSYYKEQDLKFIREAKADILCGLRVFYNSSW